MLDVRDLHAERLGGVSFALRRGEILGVGGLAGQGQRDLFMTLFGASKASGGEIRVDGRLRRIRKPSDAIRHRLGIALVPEDRKTEGLMLPMSVRDNLTLAVLGDVSHYGVLNPATERSYVRRAVQRLQILTSRPTVQEVRTLSGGNQQKVLIGRWLLAESDILLLYDITRGVDVGTKHDIYELDDGADRRGQVAPLLLERDRGDGAALPPRARHARRPDRHGARRRRSRRRGDRGRLAAGARSVTTLPTRTPYRRRTRFGHFTIQSAPLLLALIILAGMTLLYIGLFYRDLSRLPGSFEWTTLVNTSMPLVCAAVGQSIVVLTRGIDLSVGGMIDLSNSIAATHMHDGAGSMVAWTLLVLLIGAAGGLLNGVLVAYGRLQPILVTLATLSIYQGLAIKVLPEPGGAVPIEYTKILANPNGPTGLVFVGVMIVLWLGLRRTRFGIGLFAIGNDQEAARAHGVPVLLVKVGAYVLSGVFAAAGGLFLAATTTAGDATSGDVFVLTSIAAVVLGGISFFGGRGSAIGAIAGAFVLTLLINVLFFAHIDPLYQSFFQGLFLIVAVLLGTMIRRLVGLRG